MSYIELGKVINTVKEEEKEIVDMKKEMNMMKKQIDPSKIEKLEEIAKSVTCLAERNLKEIDNVQEDAIEQTERMKKEMNEKKFINKKMEDEINMLKTKNNEERPKQGPSSQQELDARINSKPGTSARMEEQKSKEPATKMNNGMKTFTAIIKKKKKKAAISKTIGYISKNESNG